MRTEQLLREAFTAIAEQPHPVGALRQRILTHTSPHAVVRRRAALVLAVVALLVLAVAVPSVLTRRTGVPADTRARGNWNMVHRVDLLPGWEVAGQSVTADSESTDLRGPARSADTTSQGCLVQVYGPGTGDPAAGAEQRTPVQVAGRPGLYAAPGPETDGGVVWRYGSDAWARVSCGTGQAQDLQIAEQVRFEVVPTRLPFRLRSTPDGYQVRSVYPPLPAADPPILGAVELSTADRSAGPTVGVVLSRGATEAPPGLAGWETDTVDGIPAVLSARDGRLCLNTRGHTLCLESGEGEPADLTKSLWPAGRRELLMRLADQVVLAPDLEDTGTWYDANRTLPR